MGKTTGWIHRSALKMKNVQMIGNVNYEEITSEGIMVSDGELRENPRLVSADTVVICAGQESDRSLADELIEKGKKCILSVAQMLPLSLMQREQLIREYVSQFRYNKLN